MGLSIFGRKKKRNQVDGDDPWKSWCKTAVSVVEGRYGMKLRGHITVKAVEKGQAPHTSKQGAYASVISRGNIHRIFAEPDATIDHMEHEAMHCIFAEYGIHDHVKYVTNPQTNERVRVRWPR